MTEEQLKKIKKTPEAVTHKQGESKIFSPDRRLIPSHHRSGGKGDPYNIEEKTR